MSNDTSRAMYATTDIIEAAVLRINGIALDHIDVNNRQGAFYFRNVPQDLLDRINTGSTVVELYDFNGKIRDLNNAIKRIRDNV